MNRQVPVCPHGIPGSATVTTPPNPVHDDWRDSHNANQKRQCHLVIISPKKIGAELRTWIDWGKRNRLFKICWRRHIPAISAWRTDQTTQHNTYLLVIITTPKLLVRVMRKLVLPENAVSHYEPCAKNIGAMCEFCEENNK